MFESCFRILPESGIRACHGRLRCGGSELRNEMRNHRRPTSLMRSATSAASVPFVILVEENMFTEVWILLHLVMVSQ